MSKRNEVVKAVDKGWSITIRRDNYYSIVVNGDSYPIHAILELTDTRVEDFRNLAKMFSKIADEMGLVQK
jgi:hypothetical protein